MPELQAQRTLVKSPPELWAEVSDPAALAKHLGEFGEIRITRTQPEKSVAWEGEHVSGTIELSASGWGTKVTMTAAVESPTTEDETPAAQDEPNLVSASPEQADPASTAPDQADDPHSGPTSANAAATGSANTTTARVDDEPTPAPFEREPAPQPNRPPSPAPAEPAAVPPAALAPAPFESDASGEEPSAQHEVARATESVDSSPPSEAQAPGFFARFFGRRRRRAPVSQEPAERTSEPSARVDSPVADPPGAADASEQSAPDEPSTAEANRAAAPTAAEPSPSDETPTRTLIPLTLERPALMPGQSDEPTDAGVDAEAALAALGAALDSLGSAHHRPFSRG